MREAEDETESPEEGGMEIENEIDDDEEEISGESEWAVEVEEVARRGKGSTGARAASSSGMQPIR
jgi:hypothetical protein